MKFPRYSYPLPLIPGLVAGILFDGQRSFQSDAIACIRRLKPPLKVFGAENIPASGPCVLTINHYHRPGFHAWWIALAVAASIPAEMHWVMTGELTFPGKWYAFMGRPGSRWLLRRLAKIYGFTTMPPMPPREKDVAARARSVRRVLEYTRSHSTAMLAMSPEGGDDPSGALSWPPPGAGRFVRLLAGQGFPIVPVGAYEEGGESCLCFGEAYRLTVPRVIGTDDKDRAVSVIVMQKIAEQLPSRLRGPFA